MTPQEKETIFHRGTAILRSGLVPKGFSYTAGEKGNSSGGYFLRGSFRKKDAHLDFSFRGSLGEVIYSVGSSQFDHKTFMRSLGVIEHEYPSFSDNPLHGFEALRNDLENYGELFLGGEIDRQKLLEEIKKLPLLKTGLDAI